MQTRFEPEKWILRIREALAAGKAFGSLILDAKEVLAEQVPYALRKKRRAGHLLVRIRDV